MLRRKVPGGFVCLRCQLRLGPVQRRPFSPSAPARDHRRAINDAIAGIGSNRSETYSRLTRPPDTAPRTHPFATTPAPKGQRPGLDRRVYRARGNRLMAHGEDLLVDTMGKPAAAIVMKEKGGPFTKFNDMPALDPDEVPEEETHLVEALERESLSTSDREILLNIHELQPEGSGALTDEHFSALQDTLADGFTKAQLETYLATYQSVEAFGDQSAKVKDTHDPPWIIERRPWMPIATEGVEPTEDALQGYVTKSMPPKQKLAIRIMRQCWDVSSQSVEELQGCLELRLRDTEFALLLIGSSRWVRSIARNYLEPGKQLEFFPTSKTISIMASQPVAEAVMNELNQTLEKAKTVSFPADLVSPEPLSPGLLDDVGKITNTLVRLDDSGKQILVTWINLPEPAKGLENLGDIVLRYLLSTFVPNPRASAAMRVQPSFSEKQGRYIAKYGCEPQLSWEHRRKQWARYTCAARALLGPRGKRPVWADIPEDTLLYPIEIELPKPKPEPVARVPFQPPHPTPKGPSGWSSQPISHTRAVFGHILHAHPKPLSAVQDLEHTLPRTFIPTLPPLQALNFPSNLHEEGLWHMILLLRFMPAPRQGPSPDGSIPDLTAAAPPLELYVEADHRELKRIISLNATAAANDVDILFPNHPFDVRMQQTLTYKLLGEEIDAHAPTVLSFLQRADIRPWLGTIATPPSLEGLALPRRLLQPLSPEQQQQRQQQQQQQQHPDTEAAVDDTIPVSYLYAGISVQRVVTAEYHGFKVGYRSSEAGPRGGKSAELYLDAVAVDLAAVEAEQRILKAERDRREQQKRAEKKAREAALADPFAGVLKPFEVTFPKPAAAEPLNPFEDDEPESISAKKPSPRPSYTAKAYLGAVCKLAEGLRYPGQKFIVPKRDDKEEKTQRPVDFESEVVEGIFR
ncbi:mitochondrial inner-membrane-bound regulator-domain-containing protein [Lasiosphaeria hispida]|uniref:Mitochondrial inner-membrane-bound regulator-domain-containing protein n=1 Tax=Lasiosphaeria hispida TaxID=260671 RepID=A0AAJ0MKB2_9PEZI|nr:mitochondrial inner-membrane-bound regulator-domain-containing protein [Lasiosphaeria hispida]